MLGVLSKYISNLKINTKEEGIHILLIEMEDSKGMVFRAEIVSLADLKHYFGIVFKLLEGGI